MCIAVDERDETVIDGFVVSEGGIALEVEHVDDVRLVGRGRVSDEGGDGALGQHDVPFGHFVCVVAFTVGFELDES